MIIDTKDWKTLYHERTDKVLDEIISKPDYERAFGYLLTREIDFEILCDIEREINMELNIQM